MGTLARYYGRLVKYVSSNRSPRGLKIKNLLMRKAGHYTHASWKLPSQTTQEPVLINIPTFEQHDLEEKVM